MNQIPPLPQGGLSKKWKIIIAVLISAIAVVAIIAGISFLGILPSSNHVESWLFLDTQDFHSLTGTTQFTINSNEWEVTWFSSGTGTQPGFQDYDSALTWLFMMLFLMQ
jgi:hypothetical protein